MTLSKGGTKQAVTENGKSLIVRFFCHFMIWAFYFRIHFWRKQDHLLLSKIAEVYFKELLEFEFFRPFLLMNWRYFAKRILSDRWKVEFCDRRFNELLVSKQFCR